MQISLLAQGIAFFATALLDESEKILHTESNASKYQPMRCSISTSSIVRKIHSRLRTGIKGACRNADTGECLLATRIMVNSVRLLPMQNKPNKVTPSKLASAVHPIDRASFRATSKSPSALDAKATDLKRRPGLAFRGTVGIVFGLGCVAPTEDSLRSLFATIRLDKCSFHRGKLSQTPGNQLELSSGCCALQDACS